MIDYTFISAQHFGLCWSSASTGVCPAALWETAESGLFTSDDSFVGDEGPSKFDTVYFKESEDDKPYFVTIPESTNPEVGMIVLKPGAMLVLEAGPSPRFDVLVNIVMHYIISVPIVTIAVVTIAGSVLTSRPTTDCTLSGCSDDVQTAGETGYNVLEGM